MAECTFCLDLYTRVDKHTQKKKCLVKNILDHPEKRTKFIQMLYDRGYIVEDCRIKEYAERIQTLDKENEDLKKKLSEIEIKNERVANNMTSMIQDNFPQLHLEPAINDKKFEIMEEAIGKEKTKYAKRVWGELKTFCDKKKKKPDWDSANDYLESQPQNTTLRKKKQALQKTLTMQLNQPVKLKNLQVTPKEKFCFVNDGDLFLYLREQMMINYDYYVIQTLTVKYGLRIHTAALLKFQHLKNIKTGIISLPDTKVHKVYKGIISAQFSEFLLNYLGERWSQADDEEYVFFPGNSVEKSRRNMIKQKVNSLIKQSKVISKKENLVYSSHCLRKTRCFLNFEAGYRKLIQDVGGVIGHSVGSRATMPYISVQDRQFRPEYGVPLFSPNGAQMEFKIQIDVCYKCKSKLICKCVEDLIQFIQTEPTPQIAEPLSLGLKNLPEVDPSLRETAQNSLMIALESQNLKFSEEMNYVEEMPIELNCKISPLSPQDLETYYLYKVRASTGNYGPLYIVHSDQLGYYVKTSKRIEPGVLICEYVGDVFKNGEKDLSKYDSIMDLNGDYMIIPALHSNIAKYIAGAPPGQNKGNVSTVKCLINNKISILIYSVKVIKDDETLFYDYNAGAKQENRNFEMMDNSNYKKLNK